MINKTLMIAVFGVIALPSAANAVVFNFSFQNTDGLSGIGNEIVAGFIEFNDNDVTPGATDVSATDVRITRIFNLENPDPFLNNGLIELNTSLTSDEFNIPFNSFSFDSQGEIEVADFSAVAENGNRSEGLFLLDDEFVTDGLFSVLDFQSNEFSDFAGFDNLRIFTPQVVQPPVEPEPTAVPETDTVLALLSLGTFLLGTRKLKF